jgi:multiple sugar transport system substrate-binding protein
MKRRLILGFFVLLALMVSVAAPVMLAANVTTIQYAFWGNPTAIGVEKDIIEEFEKANPNIKVEPIAVAYNDYHTKLLTMIAGGQSPDVMRVDSFYFADFMNAKALKDISGLIKKDKLDMSSYYPAGLQDCMKGNKYFGLPWGTAPIYMVINLKMFKDAGIPLPKSDWKYNDFLALCKQFRKGTGADSQYGFAFSSAVVMTDMFPFIWGNGGDLFDKTRKKFILDRPESVQKLQEMANLVKEGVFPDPSQFTTAEVMNRWMVNNKLAMRVGSAQELLTLQNMNNLEFEVLPFPGTLKYPRATPYKSNIVGLGVGTKKAQAAWTFLKFLRGPGQRGEMLYMQAKRIPPTFDDANLWKIYADPTKSPREVAPVSKLIAKSYGHVYPLRTGWLEIQSELLPQLQRVYSGQLSAAQAMKDIAPKIQAIMSRNK